MLFFIETLGATASESSFFSITKASNWHQLRQYLDYNANFEKVFLSAERILEAHIQSKF